MTVEWRDTPEEAAFREEARRFIAERFPREYAPDLRGEASLEPEDVRGYNWAADRKSLDSARRAGAERWASALSERGWIAPTWPRAYGGAEVSATGEFILQEEMMSAGVPPVNGIAAALLGPTLLQFGSDEQKVRFLPDIAHGRTVWAQGFSEHGAGSDLAGIATRAERRGNRYIVNGRKVWTSLAQFADWLFILARTDDAERRHRGITFLLVPADAPGVSVRPLEDLRGAQPFAAIAFDDVEVPVENRIGEENRGFYVAMATLSFERSGIGACVKYRRLLMRLVDTVRARKAMEEGVRPAAGGDAAFVRDDWRTSLRHEIVQRYIETHVLRDLALNTIATSGEVPGYEASVNQLFSAELHQRLAATGEKAFAMYSDLWGREESPLSADFTHDAFDAIANTILGGTAEVQRNVIATRGLGLPRA